MCSTLPSIRRPPGPRNARATAETRPNVTRVPPPWEAAAPKTAVPIGRASAPSPHSSGVAPAVSTAMTARSPSPSTAATVPRVRRPSANVTVTSSPRRLWALVRTVPSAMTTPEPRVPRPIPTMDGPTRSATVATADWSSSMTLMWFGLLVSTSVADGGDRLVTCNLLLTPTRDNPRSRRLRSRRRCPTLDRRRPRHRRPLEAALDRVGDRWSLLLVEALLERPRRFNELGRRAARHRPEHPDRPAPAPRARADRHRDAVPAAAAADVLRPDRGRPGPGLGPAAAGGLGRPGAAMAANPSRHELVRHGARDPLVVPDLRGRHRRSGRPRDPVALRATLGRMTMDDPRWEPGMPALDRQPVRPPVLPPSLQGLPPRSVPEVAPTPLQRHYVMLSVARPHLRGDRHHGARARRAARQPARQAVRRDRAAAPARHDGRRDRPHLALGLGVDAGRSDEGLVPARLGRRQRHRPAALLGGRAHRPDGLTGRWLDGRLRAALTAARPTSTRVVASRVDGRRRSTSARGAAPRSASGGRRARTAIGCPARRAATSRTSTRGWSSRRSRSPMPARSCSSGAASSRAAAQLGAAGRVPRGRRDGRRGGHPRDVRGDRACSSSRARSSGSTRGSRRRS